MEVDDRAPICTETGQSETKSGRYWIQRRVEYSNR